MKKYFTMPAIRLKLTGACNRTCSFCHEEGDMENIQTVNPEDLFFSSVKAVMNRTGISRIMLTGGEPTLHPALLRIVSGLNIFSESISPSQRTG